MQSDLEENPTGIPPGPKPANIAIAPEHLLGMAKGFSCLFWGIPVTLLLLASTLEVRAGSHLRIPAAVIGMLIVYYGLTLLQPVPSIGPRWERAINKLLFLIMAIICLSPFISWWRIVPNTLYYDANLLILFILTTWSLMEINAATGELGRRLCDTTYYIETQLCRWAVLLFMLVPLLYVSGLLWTHWTGQSWDWLSASDANLLQVPLWIFMPFVLPFTLTMAVVWKGKELGLQRLRLSSKVPPPPPAAPT